METGVLFLPIEEELSAKGSHWREWRAYLFGGIIPVTFRCPHQRP